ncbi:MAG: hypothetical protein LBM08_03965 [Dysgonamonadaceae bacterium]|nr:hypothetical protein [Dysgonamonadaceae bacterium]
MDLEGKILLDFTTDPKVLRSLGFDEGITRERYAAVISREENMFTLYRYSKIIRDKKLNNSVCEAMDVMGIGFE